MNAMADALGEVLGLPPTTVTLRIQEIEPQAGSDESPTEALHDKPRGLDPREDPARVLRDGLSRELFRE